MEYEWSAYGINYTLFDCCPVNWYTDSRMIVSDPNITYLFTTDIAYNAELTFHPSIPAIATWRQTLF